MRHLVPRSFVWQLVIATTVVQTVFLGFFIWYTVVTQRREAEVRFRQRLSQQMEKLAASSAYALEKNDPGGLQNVLELSRISPSIDAARLTDLKGNTLAVTTNGRNHGLDAAELAALPSVGKGQIFAAETGQIEAVAPVLEKGQPVALLWLEPNHAIASTTSSVVVRVALAYGGFALLANLLPIFLVVRSVTRPLRRLQQATAVVGEDPDVFTDFSLPVTSSNEAGQLTGAFNAMVEEIRKKRLNLLETVALLDSMLDNAPIGMAFVDRSMHYMRVNECLAALHGLPVEEHRGRTPGDFYPESVGRAKEECVQRVFATGEAVRGVKLSGPSQQDLEVQRTWLMHFYPVVAERGVVKYVGIIATEITDQLKTDEMLRKTEKLAATGRLAASIAHEVNNPLEAVTNLLYLLGTDNSLGSEANELVAMAQAELARVAVITQQTLRFYRQTTSAALTDVREDIEAILKLYRSRIGTSGITVQARMRPNVQVFGFSGELRQLFSNLISNALDAMPRGGVLHIRVRGGHGCGRDGAWSDGVHVLVADTGIGMSDKTMRRIFEAFFTTKEATGTGLGLWVCEEILQKHEATIRVRSQELVGTCFAIFFPNRS